MYGNAAPHRLRATTTTSPNNSTQQAGAISTSPVATGQPLQARNRHDAISDTSGSLAWSIPRARSPEKNLLGIPSSLVATLVDVYYSHVYNASLMVHRASFAQELKSGTASPAMVLSICALASVYGHRASQSGHKGIQTNWPQGSIGTVKTIPHSESTASASIGPSELESWHSRVSRLQSKTTLWPF